MFEYIDFQKSKGNKGDKKLILLGLTTCSFCRKAKEFLDSNNFSYDFLYLDKIDADVKKKMKAEFSESFSSRLSYPTLIIDDKELLTGFIRLAWEQELLPQEA